MKKAYELSILTGTQVLLLVVSETGLVYTFTTNKLQPLVQKSEGKNLIQVRPFIFFPLCRNTFIDMVLFFSNRHVSTLLTVSVPTANLSDRCPLRSRRTAAWRYDHTNYLLEQVRQWRRVRPCRPNRMPPRFMLMPKHKLRRHKPMLRLKRRCKCRCQPQHRLKQLLKFKLKRRLKQLKPKDNKLRHNLICRIRTLLLIRTSLSSVVENNN